MGTSQDAYTRPAYLDISVGVQYATFRDFATSPLFYAGNPIYIALSHTDFDAERTSAIQFSYTFGNLKNEDSRIQQLSNIHVFALNYKELFPLSKLNTTKFNFKFGGQFNSKVIIRDNDALGNNSDGFDIIGTLFGSAEGILDLTGGKKMRQRNLAVGLDVGLINSVYRNGFIYSRQSPLLNQDNINDGYEFRVFSGYRIQSSIVYSTWLKNGNALQLAYDWDVFNTGGDFDEFEMASHLLSLSLLFRLK